ncbi:GntR family transcriptional regulator [Sporomusa malonica]|uniref:GntR family transcriptional regulator n=1 Tax=Sporomusa malonica TaxID=112901 RepID=A0A1W1Y7P3_9FIRM|nr:GntR family transcriptional regulator [Sporomusa malonica]SMC32166.1 GntR family transcriptional regulator [Sporomusa malonica]
MPTIVKVDTEELSSKVRKALLNMLREGLFEKTGRLPAEETLAREMGISRTVLRDVLAALESEGFVSRRRGVGTIVNKHVLKVTSRMDLEKEFMEDYADAGYTPAIKEVRVYRTEANEEACQRLHLSPGQPLLVVERIVLADDREAVYCIDYIPASLIVESDYQEDEMYAPIFEFLKNRCKTTVHMGLTGIEACQTDEKLAKELALPEGVAILYLDQVGYDFDQNPVLWSKEYYTPGILHFTVLRRKVW